MNIREGMRRVGILLGVCGGILGGCLAYSDARATWDNHTAHRKFESRMASPTMQKVAKAVRDRLKPSRFGGIWVFKSQVLTYTDGTIREDVLENNTQGSSPAGLYIVESKPLPQGGTQAGPHGPWEKYAPPPGAKLVSPPVPTFDQWKAERQAARDYPQQKRKPDFKGLLSDPDFQRLNPGEQWQVLTRIVPELAPKIAEARKAGYQPSEVLEYLAEHLAGAQSEKAGPDGVLLVLVNLDGIKQVTVDKAGLISSIELSTGESVQRVDPLALKAYLIPLLYPVLGFLFSWGGIRLLTWVGSGFVEPRR